MEGNVQVLQIKFEDPYIISINDDPEKLKIIYFGEELFLSAENGLSVNGGPSLS